jgi:anti-sigma regulatory factor (Ser/Thr protein kinase)
MGWDGGVLTIVVRDTGTWRVSAAVPPRGLGLPIMMALMDNVTVDTTDGTAIRLSRRL